MAIDPATAKAIIAVAKKILTDKKTRQKILIVLSIPLVLILIIISSPFAILFGTTAETVDDAGIPVIEIMYELHNELIGKIQAEKDVGSDINEVQVIYMCSEGEAIDNSGHVLALFSIDNNMIETQDAQQVASLTGTQVEELQDLYWNMNEISSEIKIIEWNDEEYPLPIPTPTMVPKPTNTPKYTPKPSSAIKVTPTITPTPEPYRIKHVYITCLSYEDVLSEYNFSANQILVLEEMMSGEYAALLSNIGGNVATLSVEEIAEILSDIPSGIYLKAVNIPTTAKLLIGKVSYFWGGKYKNIGINPEWGKDRLVTSSGSATTGTYRPYGLDCSGYTSWVFINAGFSKDVISNYFGCGTHTQWDYSVPITMMTAKIGDLAFRTIPGSGINHVGIVVGFDTEDKPLVAHCSSSSNGVVITPFSPTFKYLRRPVILLTESEGNP